MKKLSSLVICIFVFVQTTYASDNDEARYYDSSKYLHITDVPPLDSLAYEGVSVQYGKQAAFLAIALAAQILNLGYDDFLSAKIKNQRPEILLGMMELYKKHPQAMIASSRDELFQKLQIFEEATKIKRNDLEKTKLESLKKQYEVLQLYNEIIKGFMSIDPKESEYFFKAFQLENLEFAKPSPEFIKNLKNPSSINSLNIAIEQYLTNISYKKIMPFILGTALLIYGFAQLDLYISGSSLSTVHFYSLNFIIFPLFSILAGGFYSIVLPIILKNILIYIPFVNHEKKQAFERKIENGLETLNKQIDQLNKEIKETQSCRKSA